MYTYLLCPICGKYLEKRPHDKRERRYCPCCGFVHYINPIPAVIAVVEKENSLLLIQRGKPPAQGMWTFPSGFMESGESAETACLRELKEETGLSGEITSLLGVYYENSPMYGDVVNIAYVVRPAAGSTPRAGDDAADVRYVPVQKIHTVAFASFRQALKDYRKRFL